MCWLEENLKKVNEVTSNSSSSTSEGKMHVVTKDLTVSDDFWVLSSCTINFLFGIELGYKSA